MPLLRKSLPAYFRETSLGLWLLIGVGVVRFLLKPVLGIPYEQASMYASVTILSLILLVVYPVLAARRRETYRDMLGIAAAISITTAAISIIAIGVDEMSGLGTYFTDPGHGGEMNPFLHMLGHALGGLFGTLIGWGLGALVLLIAGTVRKAKSGSTDSVAG
ncbi:MAG: hypothetical protein WAO20_23210 [Acidobacteriota bacterium]